MQKGQPSGLPSIILAPVTAYINQGVSSIARFMTRTGLSRCCCDAARNIVTIGPDIPQLARQYGLAHRVSYGESSVLLKIVHNVIDFINFIINFPA